MTEGTNDSNHNNNSSSSSHNNNNNATTSSNNSNSNSAPAACDQCRARKVRCDRQQPDCSNCRRAGISCNQTNTFKRVNHTKQLRDDFSSVLDRLDKIDETLASLAKRGNGHSTRSDSISLGLRGGPSPPSFAPSYLDYQGSDPSGSSVWSNVILPTPPNERVSDSFRNLAQPRCLTERVTLEHGGERTYKYPAPITLLKSLSQSLMTCCQTMDYEGADAECNGGGGGMNPSVRAVVLQHLAVFPFQTSCEQPLITSDRRQVVAPPHMIIRPFVDEFLRNFNSRMPIFEETTLREALDTFYSNAHDSSILSTNSSIDNIPTEYATDGPWAIIFTNIALLCFGLEIRVARWRGSQGSSINTSMLTEDLIPSFIRNCDRALADLSPYKRPSLVNVQVLVTLVGLGTNELLDAYC